MSVRQYVGDQTSHLVELSRFSETTVGQALSRVMGSRRDAIMAAMLRKPRINTEDLHDDIRYQIGMIDALTWLADVSRQAREDLAEIEKDERSRTQ